MCIFCSFTSWLLVCARILLDISILTRVGHNWSQYFGLRCLFSLIFNFFGVTFLLQTSLIALARLGLILGSHSSLLLNSSVSSHRMESVYHSDCGSVSLTTNITFLRGSSSSCCKSSSTFEGTKRLRVSSLKLFVILFVIMLYAGINIFKNCSLFCLHSLVSLQTLPSFFHWDHWSMEIEYFHDRLFTSMNTI